MKRNQWSNINNEKQLKAFIKELNKMIDKLLDIYTYRENYRAFGEEVMLQMHNDNYYLCMVKEFLLMKYELEYGEYKEEP